MGALERFQEECMNLVQSHIGKKDIRFETPPKGIKADLSLPCFLLSKNPVDFAKELTIKISPKPKRLVEKVEATGPYLNFYINYDAFSQEVIKEVLAKKEKYGSEKRKGKIIIIDYSSPNIAKPMSVGHLRSTVIGQSLYNIYKFLGYKCIGDNHLGDIGTQFGKLIVAYKLWGSRKKIEKNPIKELMNLYVKFHKSANPKLEEQAREWSKKLEQNDKESVRIWRWFVKLSMKEFNKIYNLLNVKFDLQLGESFYIPMLKQVIKDAIKKKIARESEGALIIPFDDLPPLVIQRSDEATLYQTRDLATIKYRKKRFNFHKCLYVVGSEQRLYFQQVFKAGEFLGYIKSGECIHVDFGLMRLPEGRLSTREGRIVFLEETIERAIRLAEEIIKKKNPKLKNKKRVARQIGIGAIIFNDLKEDRIKDVVFDWNKMLNFEGDSCPYVQYAIVRANSILKKAKKGYKKRTLTYDSEEEKVLIKRLSEFPHIVRVSAEHYKPHFIAQYLLDLSTSFNNFYNTHRVIGSEKENERLLLVMAVCTVLKNGLRLLNIEAPEEM